jgi:hypothetical protein
MDALMVDGNAVAGLLQEVFAVEATTIVGTCGSCGASEALGAARVFRGAGMVLRCPHCDNALGRLVKADGRLWIDLRGMRALELDVGPQSLQTA